MQEMYNIDEQLKEYIKFQKKRMKSLVFIALINASAIVVNIFIMLKIIFS